MAVLYAALEAEDSVAGEADCVSLLLSASFAEGVHRRLCV